MIGAEYVIALAAGGWHSCVIAEEGKTVKCVGWDDFGQLGRGEYVSDDNTLLTQVKGLNYGFAQISAGKASSSGSRTRTT